MRITVPIDAPELDTIAVQLANLGAQVGALTERLSHMATQEQVDAIAVAVGDAVSTINTALSGIRSDIDALKAQANVDTSGLEARVAEVTAAAQALTDLDVENPTAPPTP